MPISNYHGYYQTLIKNGTVNGAASNAYLTASYVPVKTKCIIMKYRTGTLFNQKHAVCFKLNKPYLPHLPSTRQCPAYPSWMPTHANKKYYHWDTQLACSMTFKALSKTGSLGSCVIVSMDIGSSKLPKRNCVKVARSYSFLTKTGLPPAVQSLCWLLSSLQKQKTNCHGKSPSLQSIRLSTTTIL